MAPSINVGGPCELSNVSLEQTRFLATRRIGGCQPIDSRCVRSCRRSSGADQRPANRAARRQAHDGTRCTGGDHRAGSGPDGRTSTTQADGRCCCADGRTDGGASRRRSKRDAARRQR
jgi:hypothetical protein